MRVILSIFLFLFISFNAWSQADSLTLVTKNFKFNDGVFKSFEDFKQNRISYGWDSIYAVVHTNPQKLSTLVDTLAIRDAVITDSIWGFSLGGIPYVNLKSKNKAGLNVFAGLKVRGNISYFTIAKVEESLQVIKAYNPRTGVPFREGEVMTKKEVEQEYMMSFKTGKIKPFNIANLLAWIQDDKKLVKTVEKLEGQDIAKKLFKCLLIYDDRNPIYLPVSE